MLSVEMLFFLYDFFLQFRFALRHGSGQEFRSFGFGYRRCSNPGYAVLVAVEFVSDFGPVLSDVEAFRVSDFGCRLCRAKGSAFGLC
jgi:hypothetical protein